MPWNIRRWVVRQPCRACSHLHRGVQCSARVVPGGLQASLAELIGQRQAPMAVDMPATQARRRLPDGQHSPCRRACYGRGLFCGPRFPFIWLSLGQDLLKSLDAARRGVFVHLTEATSLSTGSVAKSLGPARCPPCASPRNTEFGTAFYIDDLTLF